MKTRNTMSFQESERTQLLKESAIRILTDNTEFQVGDLVRAKGEMGKFRVLHGQKSSTGAISVIVVEADSKSRAFRAFRSDRLSKVKMKGGESIMPRIKVKAKATTSKRKSQECLCGCGGTTAGGRFLPGHDARLKGQLIASAKEGKSTAVSRLKELGWEAYVPTADPKPKSNGRRSKPKATRSRSKAKTTRRRRRVAA